MNNPAKKNKSNHSQIEGLPFSSDVCELAKDNNELSVSDIALLHTLLAGMNKKNKINWRNLDTLGLEMGSSAATVERAVKRLKQMNLIKIGKRGKKGGGYQGNEYQIIYPWKLIPLKMRETNSPQNEGIYSPQNEGNPSLKLRETNSLKMRDKPSRGTPKNNKSNTINQAIDDRGDFSTNFTKQKGKAKHLSHGTDKRKSKGAKSETFAERQKVVDAWLNAMGEFRREYTESYADRKMQAVSGTVKNPEAYRLKIIERLRDSPPDDFKPPEDAEIKAQAAHMFG